MNQRDESAVRPMDWIAIPFAYGLMWLAQTRGGQIIELLHGATARIAAENVSTDSVQPDIPFEELCVGYDAAHPHSLSNCFHSAGALSTFALLFFTFMGPTTTRWRRSAALLWVLPLWYLPAWVGHYVLQKDIPAVFTYGTTLKGLASGEACALISLFDGTTISTTPELFITLAVTIVLFLATFSFPPSSPPSSHKAHRVKVE
eukprot:m.94349 g.94349  ORF g.94349 m.94349 type:complete len:203 (-) comp26713_c0_seq2:32-640(-)